MWALEVGPRVRGWNLCPKFQVLVLHGGMKSVTGMNLVGRYLPDPSQVTGSLLNVATQPLGRVGAQQYGVAIGYLPRGTDGQEGIWGWGSRQETGGRSSGSGWRLQLELLNNGGWGDVANQGWCQNAQKTPANTLTWASLRASDWWSWWFWDRSRYLDFKNCLGLFCCASRPSLAGKNQDKMGLGYPSQDTFTSLGQENQKTDSVWIAKGGSSVKCPQKVLFPKWSCCPCLNPSRTKSLPTSQADIFEQF